MAGIYIHIPFCKQACSYCNFHFSTNLSGKQKLIQALFKEMNLRREYIGDEQVNTIYFGGGTPSLLTSDEINYIFDALAANFQLNNKLEITLEANPDDLTVSKLKELKGTPINRLSIGIQSFFDKDLTFMNRAHSSQEGIDSLLNAQNIGFENINVDLIFGSQSTTNEMWEKNLSNFFDLNISHLSAYSLTIEEKTALAHQIKSGIQKPLNDQKNFEQYVILQKRIKEQGYEQYELSNYCKGGSYSNHNTSYWFGEKYLGLGPSAHSYDQNSRQWNINNNALYLKQLNAEEDFYTKEVLTIQDKYNEYLITSLRTKWGLNKDKLSSFGTDVLEHFNSQLRQIDQSQLIIDENNFKVKPDFLFQSDNIVRDLMMD